MATDDEARRLFTRATAAQKQAIAQDPAKAGAVNSTTGHRLLKHGYTCVRSRGNLDFQPLCGLRLLAAW